MMAEYFCFFNCMQCGNETAFVSSSLMTRRLITIFYAWRLSLIVGAQESIQHESFYQCICHSVIVNVGLHFKEHDAWSHGRCWKLVLGLRFLWIQIYIRRNLKNLGLIDQTFFYWFHAADNQNTLGLSPLARSKCYLIIGWTVLSWSRPSYKVYSVDDRRANRKGDGYETWLLWTRAWRISVWLTDVKA